MTTSHSLKTSLHIRCLFLLLLIPGIPARAAAAPGAVFGKILDQSTGEPVRKVRVFVQQTSLQTVSDDQGEYRLEGIPAGELVLCASTIGYGLLKKQITIREGEQQEVVFYLAQEGSTVSSLIHVNAPVFEEVEKAAASQQTINSTELKNLAGVLIDDPLRSVQTLPGVATGDDFSATYSVRGGNFQSNGLVIDGALTHNLVHTVRGTQEPTGSITILNGDLVESMVLYAGGFSAKYGDRTSSFLDVATREGSRDRSRSRLIVGASNAALVSEGPIDRGRGSWIASIRKSYADYIIRRVGPETDLNLGFADTQGKMVYDISKRQRVAASFTWGRAELNRNPANRGVTSLIDGVTYSGLANLSWTYAPSGGVLWENRVYLIRETFSNLNRDRDTLGRGEYKEVALRTDLSIRAGARHRLEAGALVRFFQDRILDRRYDFTQQRFLDFDSVRAGFRQDAAYIQDRWDIVRSRLTAIAGVRAERTALTGQTVFNPRISLEWRPGEKYRVDVGWGIFSQFPEPLSVLGRNGDRNLRAEIARHHVLGLERRFATNLRVRVEVYDKEESDLWRTRDGLFRLVGGRVLAPDVNFHYDNALRGYSRGVEIFLQRRSANRLAGWFSYAFERTQQRDLVTRESYSGDFEQSHTINVYGSYRLSEGLNLGVKARLGSGFPYPGYFEVRGADFYLSTDRNREGLPFYSRVDFRVNKAFYLSRSKISLYLEVLNVMNRKNYRYDKTSSVNAATRKMSVTRDSLLPILPTIGFAWEF